MAYDLLVGTLRFETLHFWKFMGIGKCIVHISFIVDSVIALTALTCPVMSLFNIQIAETAIWYLKYTYYSVPVL